MDGRGRRRMAPVAFVGSGIGMSASLGDVVDELGSLDTRTLLEALAGVLTALGAAEHWGEDTFDDVVNQIVAAVRPVVDALPLLPNALRDVDGSIAYWRAVAGLDD